MQVAVARATIGWEATAVLIRAVAECAHSKSIAVSVAIVDRSGALLGFLRMTDAPPQTSDLAMDKAYTAAGFEFPSADWKTFLEQHSPAVQKGLARRPRMVMFGGGVPIRVEGACVGAVGVSGGTERQDIECAQHGIAVIGGQLE